MGSHNQHKESPEAEVQSKATRCQGTGLRETESSQERRRKGVSPAGSSRHRRDASSVNSMESEGSCRAGTAIGSCKPCPALLHPACPTLDLLPVQSGPEQPCSRGLRWSLRFAAFLPKRVPAGEQPGQHLSLLQQLRILQEGSCNARLSGAKAGGHHVGFLPVSPDPTLSPAAVMLSPEVQKSSIKPGSLSSSKEKSKQQGILSLVLIFFSFFQT